MEKPRNLREALKDKLTPEELKLVRAFDIVGDIAVVKVPEALRGKKRWVGEAILQVHSSLHTVLEQVGPVRGEFRTRRLEVLAGEPKTETIHRENECSFKVDLAKVYFSPRLAFERRRIASLVKPGEVITNMFAGVGCYSIVIAKQSQASKIYSIDKNPVAYEYMCENVRVNKVGDRVLPMLGDARVIIEQELGGRADRVLMPLPELGRDFLEVALHALKPGGGVVHFYDFGRSPDPFGPSIKFVEEFASSRGYQAEVLSSRIVRSYAPRCFHIALDLRFKGPRG